MSCAALQDAAGLKKYSLVSSSGYSAEVYEHGAQVTLWRDPAGNELLFVSKEARGRAARGALRQALTRAVGAQAIFKPPKAIRGYAPIHG